MPSLAGYGNQPYGDSDYGGSFPREFLGFRVVVAIPIGTADTSEWVVVREVRQFDSRFVYKEDDNFADARRYKKGFQTRVRFTVAPLTQFGIGTESTITTETISWIPYAGSPRTCSAKTFRRPLRIIPCSSSVSSIIVYDPTGAAEIFKADGNGKIWTHGIDGATNEATNFADPTQSQSLTTKAYVDAAISAIPGGGGGGESVGLEEVMGIIDFGF